MAASSSPSPIAPRPSALDDRLGVAAGLDQPVEHLARGAAGDGARLHEAGELGQRLRRDVGGGRVGLGLEPPDELVLQPRRHQRAVDVLVRGGRGLLEVVAAAPAGPRTAARCPPAGPSRARSGRRARPAARAARRARSRASPRSARAARGRAPGSSGSRAPPPWSAAGSARPVRGSKCSVSWLTVSPASSSAVWRSISALMPCIRKRNEFMFLSSVLVPSSSVPLGRMETLASQRSEPSSMFTSRDAELAQRHAQQRQPLARLLGGAEVGLGDDLGQRRAAAVEVDDARRRAVDAARLAEVDELRGVLLEVDAVQPHVPHVAAQAQRDVVLGDLVRLRVVGIEVVLAVEDRPRRDLAVERQAHQSARTGRPGR